MFIQKIRVRKGMKAYYSELPNKQADQNKQVCTEGRVFFIIILNMKIASMVEHFLICQIKKNKSMIGKFPKKLSEHACLI